MIERKEQLLYAAEHLRPEVGHASLHDRDLAQDCLIEGSGPPTTCAPGRSSARSSWRGTSARP